MSMPRCCLQSFVDKGIREGFKLSVFGDTHTCESCGRRYRIKWDKTDAQHGTWVRDRRRTAPEPTPATPATDAEDARLTEWADDVCHWCGTKIGEGIRALHLGVCEACAERRPS